MAEEFGQSKDTYANTENDCSKWCSIRSFVAQTVAASGVVAAGA